MLTLLAYHTSFSAVYGVALSIRILICTFTCFALLIPLLICFNVPSNTYCSLLDILLAENCPQFSVDN